VFLKSKAALSVSYSFRDERIKGAAKNSYGHQLASEMQKKTII